MKTFGINNPFSPEFDLRFFVGRENEFEQLKNSIISNRDKIVAISGNNATGKTSLCRTFLNAHKDLFNDQVEIIYAYPYHQEFPEIQKKIKLVVIEDLSYDNSLEIENKVKGFIKRYPSKQFILIGAFKDLLERFQPSAHIHLNNLPDSESTRLLLNILEKKLPHKDIIRVTQLANGQPFLLKLIAQYLNENNYSFGDIKRLVNDNLKYQGKLKSTGGIILDTSPEFQYIKSDIRVVNESILQKIKLSPNDIYNLTSRQFEEMVAELMINRGYQVDLTKATRDGGKDLIIANHTDIGNFLYYVECKKYAANNPIGVNLVRELAGTISADRVTAGIMITSSYFSPDAIQFSENFRHQISLVDFIKLKEWIKNYC
jgi:deoxyadenosine/deoxycytidine kinase